MTRLFICLLLLMPGSFVVSGESWSQFRGDNSDGIVADQTVPIEFGEEKNVVWRTEIPGRAWSSPVVSEGAIWATTAVEIKPTEEERVEMLLDNGIEQRKLKQLAIAKSIELKLVQINFETGSIDRTIELTTVKKPDPIHSLNSYASPTPVIDGGFIYCHFGTYGTFCIEQDSGQIAWQRKLPLEHGVGPGSSPFIEDDILVLIQDGMDRQYVTGLKKQTGETVWETERPEMEAPSGDTKKSYCTPIAVTDKQGRRQIICMGAQWLVAYQPRTGNEIWRLYHGKGFSVVPRPVFQDDTVYFSTGFGKPQLWAVRVDGTGDVTDTHVSWIVKQGIPAKPSPLLHEGLIYVVSDNGVASCISADDGETLWKKRIGGDYSSSPTLIGSHIYVGSHDGKVTVLQPGTDARIVAENHLDGKIMASPAIIENALILRTDTAIYRIED